MGKINESLFIIKEQLKEERDERNLKLRELQKNTEAELSSQRKFNEGIQNFMIQNSMIKLSMTSNIVLENFVRKWMQDSQARTR